MEELLVGLIKEYGYPILFIWSMAEGELGLVMAGLLCHTGDMNLALAIFVAGCGGFVGDQVYFWIGRFNRQWTLNYLRSHRRKFALAHLLLQRYGWPVIFVQRYLYGMRTVIPMAIGTTRYSSRQFALINFISAIVWAAITIMLTWYFGEPILNFIHSLKEHWYFAIPFGIAIAGTIYYLSHKYTQKKPKEEKIDAN
jgi:membrane protein DedA with SNARE-associated domain